MEKSNFNPEVSREEAIATNINGYLLKNRFSRVTYQDMKNDRNEKTKAGWWSGDLIARSDHSIAERLENYIPEKLSPSIVNQSEIDYREKASQATDEKEYGKYILNRETQDLKLDSLKPFIIELPSNMDKPVDGLEDIKNKYSEKYYFPGFEYEQYLKSLSTKELMEKLGYDVTKSDYPEEFGLMGSLYRDQYGDWQIPSLQIWPNKSGDIRIQLGRMSLTIGHRGGPHNKLILLEKNS